MSPDLIFLPARPFSRNEPHSSPSSSSSLSPGRRGIDTCASGSGGSVTSSHSASSGSATIPSRPQSVDPSELYLNKRRQSMVRHAPSPIRMSNGIIAPFPRKTAFRSPLLQAKATIPVSTTTIHPAVKNFEASVQRMSITTTTTSTTITAGSRVTMATQRPVYPTASSYDAEEDARDELMHIFHHRSSPQAGFRSTTLPPMPSMFAMDEETRGLDENPIYLSHHRVPSVARATAENTFDSCCLVMDDDDQETPSPTTPLEIAPTSEKPNLVSSAMTIDLRLKMHHLSKEPASSTRGLFLDDDAVTEGIMASSPIARAINPLAMMNRRCSLLVINESIKRGDLQDVLEMKNKKSTIHASLREE